MTLDQPRYAPASPPAVAAGWHLERLTPPSKLYAANGMTAGPDRRLYVAQCNGSRISALDVDTGELETISPLGGDIVAPDDLAFDDQGNLYVTEFMDGRVSVREPNGRIRVLCDELPGVNGIAFHQGRLFVDECRPGGRLLEIYPDGGTPRVVAENLDLPNALAPGPDGYLYFPLVGANEIWRIHPDGGAAERVVTDLGHPVAVKFDAAGQIVSTQTGTGEILRIDPRTGRRTVLAELDPGLDNLAFVGERLFVSHLTDGRITEILGSGRSGEVVPAGMLYPLGVAVDDSGTLYVSDNAVIYGFRPGERPRSVGQLFRPGYPGTVRGVAAIRDAALVVTMTDGRVARYDPIEGSSVDLARGLDQPYGVAVVPDGTVIVAERGAGRIVSIDDEGRVAVLAGGLGEPVGLALGPDGAVYLSAADTGRVARLTGGGTTVIDALQEPQGIAVSDGTLYVVDASAHALIAVDLGSGVRHTLATGLPVGAPPGVTPKPLRGAPPFSGPFGYFAGVAVDARGALCFSADTEGSVLALVPASARVDSSAGL